MSISSEEAATIKAEHNFLKDQVSQVVSALHKNTEETSEFKESVRELVHELKERDIKDEFRQKEFEELKKAVASLDAKFDKYIDDKQPILEWAAKRMEWYDSISKGMQSTWGKMLGAIIFLGVLAALGLDLTNIKVG